MGANNSIPANYSAVAYAVLALDIVLTTAAVVGRTVSRKLMKARLSTDDTLTYVAYVCYFLSFSLIRAKLSSLLTLGCSCLVYF